MVVESSSLVNTPSPQCTMHDAVGAGVGPNLAEASQPIPVRKFCRKLKVWLFDFSLAGSAQEAIKEGQRGRKTNRPKNNKPPSTTRAIQASRVIGDPCHVA